VANALFFEAQPFGMQEPADRFRVQLNAVLGQGFPQFPHRTVRPLGNQPMDQFAMRLKAVALVAAVFARRNRAGLPVTLPPAHNARNRKPETRRHNTTTVAGIERNDNTLTKIKRVRTNHHMLASISSQHVESETNQSGNPKSTQSISGPL
jgi:hypothetical protein